MGLTLYFLRHGQTALSRQDTFSGSGSDPELTPEGLQMAQAFADAYHSKSWTAIYASDSRRAIETAGPLRERLGLPVEVRPGLGEIAYGEWDGLSKEEVKRLYQEDYEKWLSDPFWHAPTGGETAEAIVQRVLKVTDEIRKKFENGNVLIVSHKATIRIILCELLAIDIGRFRYRLDCPVGSVSVVEFKEQGPLLRSLADRCHLSEALRNLPGT